MKNYTQQDVKGAWHLIQQANTITLLTHYKPDADGMSACAALAHIFTGLGKEVETIYPTEAEVDYQRQGRPVRINTHTLTPDLLIACDTANYDRLYYPEAFKSIPLINIDHHISNSIKGTFNLVNGQAASTCEELLLIIKQWDSAFVDTYVAECLLFGILYDTQVFHTTSTTAKTLRIAADLIDCGANLFALKDELLCTKNPAIVKLWGDLLSSVTISPSGQAAWAVITQADLKRHKLELPALVGFSNFLAEISGVDVSIIFCEMDDGKTKVSLRSKTVDVNAIAAHFGGGGHKNASGMLSNLPIGQVVQEVTALL